MRSKKAELEDVVVLADRANKKVCKLSDQSTPEKFAGEKVKVTGTLDGDTIKVASIEAAH